MKRFLLLFLLPLSAWAVTRTVTISAPSTIVTGQSFVVPTSVSTDAGGGEQIGFYHAEFSTNGGASWTGFCYDVNVGASATRNAYITAGGVGSTIQVRVRIAFRGGPAGDVDYNGSAINWGGSWDAWQTPPTKYATISVVAPPNQPPTINWIQNPASVYVNQWFPIQSRGDDPDGNLTSVNVWKEWVPYAFNGGGNGYQNYSDPNQTYGSAPGSITFQTQAGDSAGGNSAVIFHTVTVTNRAPYGAALSGSGSGITLMANGQYEMWANNPITLTAVLHDYDGNLAFHGIWHNNGTGITDGSTWQQLPNTGTPSNGTDSTLVRQFTPAFPGRWDFHTNGHDGTLWAGGSSITVYVYGQTNNAAFVSQVVNGVSNPTSLTFFAGQTIPATVTMANNGEKPWTTDSTPHRLGSANPNDNTRWGLSRVALPSSPINPAPQSANTAVFSFNVTAPTTLGTYQFQWQMVEDGVQWFGAATPAVSVNVIASDNPTLIPRILDAANNVLTPDAINRVHVKLNAQVKMQLAASSPASAVSVLYWRMNRPGGNQGATPSADWTWYGSCWGGQLNTSGNPTWTSGAFGADTVGLWDMWYHASTASALPWGSQTPWTGNNFGWATINAPDLLVDNSPPSVPANLSATSVLQTSFVLNWNAASDDNEVYLYEVFRNGVSIGTTGSTSISVTGLATNVTYSMTVRARDRAGNWSAVSAALPVLTSFDPNGDADNDGVSNADEQALGLNPNDASDTNVYKYEYDKVGRLKKGPGGTYTQDAEGNIKQIGN